MKRNNRNTVEDEVNKFRRVVDDEFTSSEEFKRLLSPEVRFFLKFYDYVQGKTVERFLEFQELLETKRFVQLQSLAEFFMKLLTPEGEKKSPLRQKFEDIMYIIQNLLPLIQPKQQKPKLEIK